MGKHGIIENTAKRCRCGRIKPAARAVCYTCKPRYSRKAPPESIYGTEILVDMEDADDYGYFDIDI